MVEISQKVLKTYMYNISGMFISGLMSLVYIRNRIFLFCSKICRCKQEVLLLLPLVEAQVLHIDRARDRLFTLQNERQKNVWRLVQVAVRTAAFLVITGQVPLLSVRKDRDIFFIPVPRLCGLDVRTEAMVRRSDYRLHAALSYTSCSDIQ